MLVTEEGFEIREDAPVFGKMAIEDKVLWGNNTFLWDAEENLWKRLDMRNWFSHGVPYSQIICFSCLV